MSNLLSSKDFGLKVYDRFPPKYREDDVLQGYALKRYIEVLSDGGFSPTIEDINGITTLINPDKVDSKVLPLLFQQYGFDVFNGIPEQYLRYFLPKLGEAYSLKGSLSVVQFITSSLSGVKVSLDTIIDESSNILVALNFEMDYNIGDYFPDVNQFNRILDKFLPFYVDRSIKYSYMFYESQVVRQRESSFMKIGDLKEESSSLRRGSNYIPMTNNDDKLLNTSFILNSVDVEVETYKDIVKYSTIEDSSFNTDDDTLNVINIGVVKEELRTRINDNLTDSVLEVYNEPIGIPCRGVSVIKTSVLGHAVLGESVLNELGDYSDVTKDHIVMGVEENVSITSKPSLTNGSRTINNFTLNDFSNVCFDVVTYSDGRKLYYTHN